MQEDDVRCWVLKNGLPHSSCALAATRYNAIQCSVSHASVSANENAMIGCVLRINQGRFQRDERVVTKHMMRSADVKILPVAEIRNGHNGSWMARTNLDMVVD
ncbi:hypothetical protein GQ44DRAFT_13879 [Phaeosphaeriaceae sp. PMI808]|nr:hypothetical protein GQ44DRAFT_13879 [Phaeosphaeriaceae sp. PMI808]